MWQSFDTAPKDGSRFDVWFTSCKTEEASFRLTDCYWESFDEGEEGLFCHSEYGYFFDLDYKDICKPTHWMKIPEGPKE